MHTNKLPDPKQRQLQPTLRRRNCLLNFQRKQVAFRTTEPNIKRPFLQTLKPCFQALPLHVTFEPIAVEFKGHVLNFHSCRGETGTRLVKAIKVGAYLVSKVGETIESSKMDCVGREVEGMEGGGEEGVAGQQVTGHVSKLHHVSRLEDLYKHQQ